MFDPMYFVFIIPGLVLAGFAALYTRSMFSRYAEIPSSSGLTGAQAARRMLETAGIYDVSIEEVDGFLSDHYDPSTKTLRLSPDVYHKANLSSVGVACHEAGHAIQHAESYAPLELRSALVPATNFCATFAPWIIIAGVAVSAMQLALLGVILFSATVLFSLVTLPVEWDASARAKSMLVRAGIVYDREELSMSGRVLNAAFMTYVAAAVTSILTLLYYLWRMGLLNGTTREE